MTDKAKQRILSWWRADRATPAGFVHLALGIVLVFVLCRFCGLDRHTTFLSGTPAETGMSLEMSAFLGTAYMAVYFSFVLLAPILLLAAGFMAAAQGWIGRQRIAKTNSSP
jgi:hypothetical protein